MLRPSEMLVSFLQHLQASGFRPLYYKGELVETIEQIEYDKFVVRYLHMSDEEIRCDGILISEFFRDSKGFSNRLAIIMPIPPCAGFFVPTAQMRMSLI